jgi:16S rRNA pseudouridine516 synthase
MPKLDLIPRPGDTKIYQRSSATFRPYFCTTVRRSIGTSYRSPSPSSAEIKARSVALPIPPLFSRRFPLTCGMSAAPRLRRLDQILSASGYCSRRDARAWVKHGRLTIDGVLAESADLKADPARVCVDGQPVDDPEGLLALYHKPIGYVCSHEEGPSPTIYQALPERWPCRNPAVSSVGRLDKDATGLLLMTDQGELIHRWTSPRHHVPRVYEVTVDKPLNPDLIPKFASGALRLPGDTEPCLPARLALIGDCRAELELTEGRYHQVKRMFAGQGWQVMALHRIRFGPYELGDLPVGTWRQIPLPDFSAGR